MKRAFSKTTRRRFLKTAAAAVAAPYVITSTALGQGDTPAASERITFGGIGMGGRGSADLRAFMGHGEVQVLAVCDVKKDARASVAADVTAHDEKGRIYMRMLGAEVTISEKLKEQFLRATSP